MAGGMAQQQTGKTVTYSGQSHEEVQRAYEEDRARASAAGYEPLRFRWDTAQPQPTLVVEYVQSPAQARPGVPLKSAGSQQDGGRGCLKGCGIVLAIGGLLLIGLFVGAVLLEPVDPEGSAQRPDKSERPNATQQPQEVARTAGGSLRIPDGAGDLIDPYTDETTRGPGYMDVTDVEASVDGDELAVRFEVAGRVPAELDPFHTSVGYFLLIDTDGDDFENVWVQLDSIDDWTTYVWDWSTSKLTEVGEPEVVGSSVSATIPLSVLGSPSEMRFRAEMQASDFADPVGDPLNASEWEDRAPDDEAAWLTLSESE